MSLRSLHDSAHSDVHVMLPIGVRPVKSRYLVKMDTFTVAEFGRLDAKHPSSRPLDR